MIHEPIYFDDKLYTDKCKVDIVASLLYRCNELIFKYHDLLVAKNFYYVEFDMDNELIYFYDKDDVEILFESF